MLKIRPMQLEDIERIFAIETSSHQAPWSREILRDCVLVKYDCRIVEDIDEFNDHHIVAYLICRYQENVCHILNLCVDTFFQGKGFGRILLQDLLASLDKIITAVVLEVRPSNQVAINLYKSLGFQTETVKRGYYRSSLGDKEDALVLKKYL